MDAGPGRLTPEELLRRATETDELAALVSYAPDKRRLMLRADELRRAALRLLSEGLSWTDPTQAAAR